MKTRLIIFTIVISLFIGCAPTSFYQLYKTQSNDIERTENRLIFENEDIEVAYNFWGNHGNGYFLITNQTDSNLFIDLGKSHLILNGFAKTYSQNRTFTESSASDVSTGYLYSSSYLDLNSTDVINSQVSTSIAKGSSVSYTEKKIVIIPAKSAKIFGGYSLNTTIYRYCDLLRFPTKKSIETKIFDQGTTPLIFKNIIAYGFNEHDLTNYKSVENTFWISEITNYPEISFYELKYDEYCEEKSSTKEKFFLFVEPNSFFIKYTKDMMNPGFDH